MILSLDRPKRVKQALPYVADRSQGFNMRFIGHMTWVNGAVTRLWFWWRREPRKWLDWVSQWLQIGPFPARDITASTNRCEYFTAQYLVRPGFCARRRTGRAGGSTVGQRVDQVKDKLHWKEWTLGRILQWQRFMREILRQPIYIASAMRYQGMQGLKTQESPNRTLILKGAVSPARWQI
jgi:hypothetical protein